MNAKIKEIEIGEDGRGQVTLSYTFSVQAVDEEKMRSLGRLPLTFGNKALMELLQDHLRTVIFSGKKKVKEEFVKDLKGWLADYSTIEFLDSLGIESTPLKVKDGKIEEGLK